MQHPRPKRISDLQDIQANISSANQGDHLVTWTTVTVVEDGQPLIIACPEQK